MTSRYVTIVIILLSLLGFDCDGATKLKVALFPYLPYGADHSNESLRIRLEKEFEALHPDVDLELRKFDPENDDFYDPLWIAQLLKEGLDVVEIDTVLLGTLLDLEVISPWPSNIATADWQQIALESARMNGEVFGFPHWMCGYFIITGHESVARATTVQDLTKALHDLNTPSRDLVGDLLGSWDTAAIYLDAWADTRSERDISIAVGLPLDSLVLSNVVAFAALGESGGVNPIISGSDYDDTDKAPVEFGKGEADALFGYSERIHYAVKAGADPVKLFVSSAPIGNGSDPLWFVDSLVIRNYPKPSSKLTPAEKAQYNSDVAQRKNAAKWFAEYLDSPATFAWIHTSEDLGDGAKRRYLIPATKSAFETSALKGDPIMKQIRPLISQGTFFPRSQLPGARRAMGREIKGAWSNKSSTK